MDVSGKMHTKMGIVQIFGEVRAGVVYPPKGDWPCPW